MTAVCHLVLSLLAAASSLQECFKYKKDSDRDTLLQLLVRDKDGDRDSGRKKCSIDCFLLVLHFPHLLFPYLPKSLFFESAFASVSIVLLHFLHYTEHSSGE